MQKFLWVLGLTTILVGSVACQADQVVFGIKEDVCPDGNCQATKVLIYLAAMDVLSQAKLLWSEDPFTEHLAVTVPINDAIKDKKLRELVKADGRPVVAGDMLQGLYEVNKNSVNTPFSSCRVGGASLSEADLDKTVLQYIREYFGQVYHMDAKDQCRIVVP